MKKLIAIALLAMSFTATATTSDDWTFDEWSDWCGDYWEPAVESVGTTGDDFHANMMYADNLEFQLGRSVDATERALIREIETRQAL
jgi:hypothetical protein